MYRIYLVTHIFAVLAVVLAAVLLSLGLTACGSSVAAPEVAATRAAAAPVRVATAGPADFLSQIRTVGRVEPDRSYVLAFKTAGVVSTLHVDEGDAVKQGQVLAELDPRDVDAQLREAQEAADKADRELVRIRQLHAKGFASDAELQDAQAQAKSTQRRGAGGQIRTATTPVSSRPLTASCCSAMSKPTAWSRPARRS